MTTPLQDIDTDAANAQEPINENFESVGVAGLFGKRQPVTTGLTWGYYGGRYLGNDVADGTVTLTNTATNYIVVARSSGTVSVSTSTTNWNDPDDYARIYEVDVAGGAVTGEVDCRADTGGVFAGGGGGGGGGSRSTVSALASTSGVVNIDYSLGDYFTHTLDENVTSITFSNLPGAGNGATLMIRITQDSTPRTVAWPASFRWVGGTDGVVSTGSGDIDVLAITTFDNGTTWIATLANDFAA